MARTINRPMQWRNNSTPSDCAPLPTNSMYKQTIIDFLNSFALVLLALCLCCVLVLLSINAYRHMLQYHKPIRKVNVFSPEAITPLLHDDSTARLSSTRVERVHVIILVHGFVGCPQDLAYLHHACEEQAATVQTELHKELEPFYVYTCVSNHGRTNDGIVAGADRVAQEVRGFLESVHDLHNTEYLQEMTISIVGYSLGGLYARYALPEILQPLDSDDKNDNDDAGMFRPTPALTPKVFCTIATPHLGSHGHTYVPVPKAIEKFFSWFSPTGRDLFHRSNVIHQTVSDPKWVEPLLKFERRVAYANTYASDIMVPTSTAAFVTPHSALEHFLVDTDNDDGRSPRRRNNNNNNNNHIPFAALVVETPAQHDMLREQLAAENEFHQQRRQQSSDSSTRTTSWDHARRLDAMGWSKVFVDFTNSYQPDVVETTTATGRSEYDFQSNTTSFQRRRSSFQSSELHAEFQKNKNKMRAFLPNGHDQIAVNSKNVFYSYALRRGRPLIDELANEFVRDVLLGPSPSLLSSSTALHLSSSSVSNALESNRVTTNEDATATMDPFSIACDDVAAASS